MAAPPALPTRELIKACYTSGCPKAQSQRRRSVAFIV